MNTLFRCIDVIGGLIVAIFLLVFALRLEADSLDRWLAVAMIYVLGRTTNTKGGAA